MKAIIGTVLMLVVLAVIGGFGFIYSGVYDVGASTPHWAVTRWVMDTARMHSIAAHASGIAVPAGLDDQSKILMGTDHFAAHCAVCHGAPGVPQGDIAKGLYPQPPNLARTVKAYSPAELFWVLKHGIKMTGMPAWSDHGDDALWAIVAFLEKLPTMSEQDYAKLVMASMAMGGMDMGDHHQGDADSGSLDEDHDQGGEPLAPAESRK